MIKFIGIDPSYTNTAVVVTDENGSLCAAMQFGNMEKTRSFERPYNLKNQLQFTLRTLFANQTPVVAIAIEDMALGAMYRSDDMALLQGVYRTVIKETGLPTFIVNPGKLKSFVGAGQTKASVKEKILELYGPDVLSGLKNDDMRDAFVLSRMACICYSLAFGANYIEAGKSWMKNELFINPKAEVKKSGNLKGQKVYSGILQRKSFMFNVDLFQLKKKWEITED